MAGPAVWSHCLRGPSRRTAPGLGPVGPVEVRGAALPAGLEEHLAWLGHHDSLPERQGYEGTTVAQIAAAAGVSTKTFFNYFPSKEDVVFINPQRRVDAALALIAARRGEPLADVLVAAVEQMLWHAERDDLATGMAATRLHLIRTVPALQAAALRRIASAAVQLTRAVDDAYRPELDENTAAAIVGALLGAVIGVTNVSLQRGDSPGQLAAAVRRAVTIAVRGMQSASSHP